MMRAPALMASAMATALVAVETLTVPEGMVVSQGIVQADGVGDAAQFDVQWSGPLFFGTPADCHPTLSTHRDVG